MARARAATRPRPSLRAYAHDIVQVAARLPRQSVLIGHGTGGLAVAYALARYPARAGVLVGPVFGGWGTLATALLRNPAGTLPAIFGGKLRLRRRQLFGREAASEARQYTGRVGGPAAPIVQWQMLVPSASGAPGR